MNRLLSVAFRVTLLMFLLGGTIFTFAQIAGILIADGSLVTQTAGKVGEPTCVVAGVAGLLAFARMYVAPDGKSSEYVSAQRKEPTAQRSAAQPRRAP
ncbi:hypothetical protein [Streptomyces sp. NRRL B-3229]|uniref:hypothetical protein n=1 Tax=Streptomyces sp. NRRL B-3229 TaxID=1463836 RepID=UPI000691BF72|nr:hypothetical protein [Streptomyces sp. NRRL B-3229]